jgi:hypothetical protein
MCEGWQVRGLEKKRMKGGGQGEIRGGRVRDEKERERERRAAKGV